MTARFRSIASFVALCLALPMAAHAESWQSYLSDPLTIHELDADSVRIDGGLVHFDYRERPSNGRAAVFDKPVEGAVDCEGRRSGDVVRGKLDLRPIFEGTQSAYKLDFACRLAGRGTRTHVAVARPASSDWVTYFPGASIDRNTIQVREGLVYYSYLARGGYTQDASPAVVDCAHRQRSEGTPERHDLLPITEGSPQARQAEMACKLAQLPMPPGPTPVPVDFSERVPESRIGSDNLVYDIFPPSLKLREGLVHFVYFTPYLSDGTTAILNQPLFAVVDCAGRRRSEESAGQFDLKPVEPGTRGANQVDRICRMAAKLAADAPP